MIHNKNSAREICFNISTKNTILKRYDGRFKDIFEEIYEKLVPVVIVVIVVVVVGTPCYITKLFSISLKC